MYAAINRPLLVAKSTDETKSDAVDLAKLGVLESVHHIKWASGVTAGEVQIEVADDTSYTGTWAVVATVTFSGTAPKQDVVNIRGTYSAIRHRINTAVSGGATPSVTTRIAASN